MIKTDLEEEDFTTFQIYKDYSKIKLDKKYDWLIPLITGLLIFISILFPAAYTSTYRYPSGNLLSIDMLWIWNYYATFEYQNISLYGEFLNLSHILTSVSVILTFLIIIIGIIFSINAIRIKRKKTTYEKSKKLWIRLSIILVFSVLLWIVLIEIFSDENIVLRPVYISVNIQRYSFWSYFSPGFSIYGFFLSVLLIGLRVTLDKSYKKTSRYIYFIAFTIMIISLFTPLVNFNAFIFNSTHMEENITFESIWVLGYKFLIRIDFEALPVFTYNFTFLFDISLMICLVIFIICTILTFIFALRINEFRGLYKKFWYFEKILASIIFFIITFCLLILNMNYEYSEYFLDVTYRSQSIIGFGILGPYISASLIIISIFLQKSIER
jgi:hypothetical protein